VAREHGWREPYLSQLVDVRTNLQIGCKHLAGHLAWAKGDIDKALRAYNGGRGGVTLAATAPYPIKVRTFLADIRGKART
jgi:soluble lytic murein transglycosylase-like protein